MAKKIEQEEVEIIEQDQVEEKPSKKDGKVDKQNASKNVNKKPKKERKSLWKKMKEVSSELKKVSWPSFGKVVKQTGVVILVVTVCTLLLFGVDKLFSLFYNLLTK